MGKGSRDSHGEVRIVKQALSLSRDGQTHVAGMCFLRQEVPVSVPLMVLSTEWQLYDSNLKMYFCYRMFCFS